MRTASFGPHGAFEEMAGRCRADHFALRVAVGQTHGITIDRRDRHRRIIDLGLDVLRRNTPGKVGKDFLLGIDRRKIRDNPPLCFFNANHRNMSSGRTCAARANFLMASSGKARNLPVRKA
jgi:hypothetical protein